MRTSLVIVGGVGLVGLVVLAIAGIRSPGGSSKGISGRAPTPSIERVATPRAADRAVDNDPTRSPGSGALRERRSESDGSAPHEFEAGGTPGDLLTFDEEEVPSREVVRAAIETAVAERFTDYRLSSDELDRATDALVTLRETQVALRALPIGPETATERRILVERIGEATSGFNAVFDMDPADFTAEAEPGGGIDRFDPNEIPPEPEFLERPR